MAAIDVPVPAGVRSIESLPGPRGLPVLGNALQVPRHRAHQQFEQWSREHGPFYRLQMGKVRMLVSADPQFNAALLKDRPAGFRRSSRIESVSRELGVAGVFSVNGEQWRRQRPMVMAAFDPAHIRAYFPSLVTVTQRLLARWRTAAAQQRRFDLPAELMLYTVDVTAGLAFGADINTLESQGDVLQQHLKDVFRMVHKRVFAPFEYWHWLRLPEDRRLDRDLAAVRRAVDGFIAQARARIEADPALRERPANLIEAMVAARDRPDSGLTDADVSGNVLTMLLAGEDTTANTLAWLIHLLHEHPDALARLRREVDAVLGDDLVPIRLEQAAALEFTQACAEEAMRLKPVAPMMLFQAEHDTTLAGIAVPRNTVLCTLMRPAAVDPAHFGDAQAFRPQRWLEEVRGEGLASPKRVSMPFGAGPRMCPGRYLALLEIRMVIAMLVRNFDLESVGTSTGAPVQERMSFTMAPADLQARLRLRT